MSEGLPSTDQMHQVLRTSARFGALDEAHLALLVQQLRPAFVQAGAHVYREGDASDGLVLVIDGRLRVTRTDPRGSLLLYNELCPGESQGEAGLILGQRRQANLIALRDTQIARLDRAGFEALLRAEPVLFNQLFSQALHDYLRHVQQLQERRRAQTIAVLPLHPGPEGQMLAQGLLQAFGERARLLAPSGELASEADLAHAMNGLERLETEAELLLIQAEAQFSPWTRFALRHADQLVFVSGPKQAPLPSAFERRLREEAGFEYKRQHLVLLHPADSQRPAAPGPWRKERQALERVLLLRQDRRPDFERLARFLTGRAVGVVLGGGGARGFAHLGVLRALDEAGIPIDLMGGNSMGALIGSQFALGASLDEIRERIVRFAAGGERPTVPVVSLLSGRRMERDLKLMCQLGHAEAQVDALWLPFFTAACNLSRACTTVLDHGPLWRAVLASNSPAGLLPPVLYNGDLLVDGAILDNVPVEAMRQRLGTPLERRRGNGTVIAIDVDVREPLSVQSDMERLSPWAKLRGVRSEGQALPGIGEILYRAGHMGGLTQRGKTIGLSDFYLEPPVADFSLMAYKRAAEVAQRGYEYAQTEIARWDLSRVLA
ncbi:NTE family protein/lysophospholipid hydrolase [Inhella inkyongensis]|uniref:NTE family protein/lysophospholipid hydrolase n=1 Tax=Inhella inkyongensis TaxID=392593 RepID=A0A840S3N9_9BURK|nr:cyclic nucleotide-binding and patatin-like phospholipase domain-containing protein [Inhella inkyongensis]MBB5204058.1 NTE family protein/lysophospholipid hydrolase [Inhella inkyongensis]